MRYTLGLAMSNFNITKWFYVTRDSSETWNAIRSKGCRDSTSVLNRNDRKPYGFWVSHVKIAKCWKKTSTLASEVVAWRQCQWHKHQILSLLKKCAENWEPDPPSMATKNEPNYPEVPRWSPQPPDPLPNPGREATHYWGTVSILSKEGFQLSNHPRVNWLPPWASYAARYLTAQLKTFPGTAQRCRARDNRSISTVSIFANIAWQWLNVNSHSLKHTFLSQRFYKPVTESNI